MSEYLRNIDFNKNEFVSIKFVNGDYMTGYIRYENTDEIILGSGSDILRIFKHAISYIKLHDLHKA